MLDGGSDIRGRTMKTCVYCESSVQDEVTKCPHCSSTSFVKQCPKCGKGYKGAECPDCEAREEAAKAAEASASQEKLVRDKANSRLALKTVLTVLMPYIGGYFLINRNVKKGFRLFAIVWCFFIAFMMAASYDSAATRVVGVLLCLAPVAVYAIREKAWSWREAGLEVKITSVALVVALVVLLASAIGRGDQQVVQAESTSSASAVAASSQSSDNSSSSAEAKPTKDGFDEKTNAAVQVAGVEFSIPDYYVLSKGSGSMDYYYAEQGGAVAMIGVETDAVNDSTESDFDSSKYGIAANFAKSSGFTIRSTKDASVAGLPGCVAELDGKIENIDTQMTLLFFFNERESSLGYVLLAQTNNTKFDYTADFEKVIESAKIGAAATGEQVAQSSSSGASAKAEEEESSASSAPSEEEKLAALESVMSQDTAYRAATVSFTNQMADDVFADDGNSLDPSKFHSYSDRSGFYLEPKSRGTWSYKDDSTWHVEGLEYTIARYGTSVKASCDVRFDGENYIISNQRGMIYNPGHEDLATHLEEYEKGSSSAPARVVAPDLLS